MTTHLPDTGKCVVLYGEVRLSEGAVHFHFFESLDEVTLFKIVVSGYAQTAVVAREDFLDVVLESFERAEFACEPYYAVAYQADFARALDLAFSHNGTCDCSDF